MSNVDSISDAELVIIGLPDETKSDSLRVGVKKGPDNLRNVYNESQYFKSKEKKIPILPMSGMITKRVYDFGNVSRDEMHKLIFEICSLNKIPIILGGDHSLTTIALRAINECLGEKIGLLYFDAHPDFLTSVKDFHGSVLSDSIDCLNFQRSLLIGIRAMEPEELDNICKTQLEYVTPLDVIEKGLSSIADKIISKCGTESSVYLSIDLDCIDPAFAPAVSVPSPFGLMPLELVSLVKKACSKLRIIGMDLVELCPDYDVNENTARIGSGLLLEAIASVSTSDKTQKLS